MNIFRLHNNPELCAQWHCDKHVVKMITEQCQLMSMAHHAVNSPWIADVYKATHSNHPSAVWTRASTANYIWLFDLTLALSEEYTYRYGKTHACKSKGTLRTLANVPMLPRIGETPFAQAVPEDCKDIDPVKAYQKCYALHKSHILSWRGRPMPPFLKEYGYHAVVIESK